MTMTTTHLPATLHELLMLALDDLKAIENTPGYVINMSVWHQYDRTDEICSVCLAGSVMSRHLDADYHTDYCPRDFTVRDCEKLMALNWARRGMWRDALHDFYEKHQPEPVGLPTPPLYYKDPEGFHNALREAAQVLKEHNL